jgi:exopolysaccharide biosynthesis polyprenyl glycosylphosphotransferase
MILASRKTLLEVGMCLDLAICGISLLLGSAVLYRPLWQTDALLLQHPLRQMVLTIGLGFCWHYSLVSAGAYRSYRTLGKKRQIFALVKGATFVAGWAALWLALSGLETPVSLNSFLLEIGLFWAFGITGMIASRMGARLVTRYLRRRGRNLRNLLVVGTNSRAVAVADSLLADKNFGYQLVGFVDDCWHYEGAPEHYKSMLVGQTGDTLQLLRDLELDEVIVALPIASHYQLTERIISWCRQQGILVRYEGSLFENVRRTSLEPATPSLITLHDAGHDPWSSVGKRLIDLVLSSIAIIALLPVLAAVALAIRLTSEGPVLFQQERLGLGKRRFRIYKFRTMVVNAEARMKEVEHLNQSQGPTFKLKHDPRITPVGNFLRKTSLDELPQLFNVFLGDMSLVGPRPLPMRDYQGFSEDWHRRRFSVKPGITCLWQVTGRSSIGFERWMELDMEYIDQWSLWLDLKIIAQTIPAVVRGSGAM